MTERDLAPGGIDTTTPNVARIYDYLHRADRTGAVDARRGRPALL